MNPAISGISYPLGGLSESNPLLSPSMAHFSTYNFIKNCNYLFDTPGQEVHLKALREIAAATHHSSNTENHSLFASQENDSGVQNLMPKHIFSQANLLPYPHPLQLLQRDSIGCSLNLDQSLSPSMPGYCGFKKRSEKRPIPDDQKDDKYFERRRRNNQAAKKSRDARKMREDQVALRATILEHENAILRAQVVTLREEASSLRQMLLHRKPYEINTTDAQLCVLSQ
ncbi:transcription factor ces-2 [Euwallacea similis]|uniref:transcription factor ces-2 n=1 Tax=Euwallacea similis TaxID=1736056 RepID=UPI00345013C8